MRTWMRRGACAWGLGMALLSGGVQAEEEARTRRTAVMVQPVSGFLGQVGVAVEHAPFSALALTGGLLGSWRTDQFHFTDEPYLGDTRMDVRRLGIGMDAGVHFHILGQAPEGLWVGPHLEAMLFNAHILVTQRAASGEPLVTSETSRSLAYGGSVRAGYTAVLFRGLTLQAGVGIGKSRDSGWLETPKVTRASGITRPWSTGPRLTLGLGWTF